MKGILDRLERARTIPAVSRPVVHSAHSEGLEPAFLMRIVEATVDDSSISNFLDGIGQIAPLPFTVAGHGKCGQEKSRCPLTNPLFPAILPLVNAMTGKSSAVCPAKRAPGRWKGERAAA